MYNKKVVAFLFSVCIVFSLFLGVQYGRSFYIAPATNTTLTYSPPFSAASYIVTNYNSTFYCVKNCSTGVFDSISSSFATVQNYAFNNNPAHGKIVTMGTFTVDDTLKFGNDTEWKIIGTLTAAAGMAGKNIIQNKDMDDDENHHVWIHGGYIDGNHVCDDGIRIGEVSNAPYNSALPSILISDVQVYNCEGWGLNATMSSGTTIHTNKLSCNECQLGGVFLSAVDSDIEGGFFGCSDSSGFSILVTGAWNRVHPDYVNSRVEFYTGHNFDFSTPIIDNLYDQAAGVLQISEVKYSRFHDITIHCGGNGATTNPAVLLIYNCTNNQFDNMIAGRCTDTGTRRYSYVVLEYDAWNNNNFYLNIDGSDCTSGSLSLKGAGSKTLHNNTLGTVTET